MKGNIYTRHDLVCPGDRVFDVGLKVGKMTDLFLQAGARVICVEPMPDRVRYMREKYGTRIQVIERAVGAEFGTATLHVSSKDKLNPTLVPDTFIKQFRKARDVYDEKYDVFVTTLDSLALIYGLPVFIKLDIEGSEYAALQGMTVPVPALSFEFGMGYIEEAHKCIALLDKKGYEFNYTRGHHDLELKEWLPAERFVIDVPLCNENDKFVWGNVYARLRGE